MRKRPGLIILIGILIFISVGIIKPEFYMMGWDNFSSYLNPAQNIFNTFFTAWRQHRGLGVPSDAENADLFRQLFCLITSLLFGKQLADQFYMVAVLWGGMLGMYFLGRWMARHLHFTVHLTEIFGFVSAFFYLFNLSTLAVFYFPMIMYNTRFFMLPTTVLTLLILYTSKHIPKPLYFFYCAVLLIGSGAFMVPTIFVVFMLGLGLLPFFLRNIALGVKIAVFFILLNSYWLLMFTNYTIQKSAVVPSAPTFVEINESMLNKPKSFYSFERQAKLRPSFFESEFTNITSNNKSTPFHALAREDEKGIYRVLFWIFPILYLLGITYTLFFRRDKLMLWFASITSFFLILSMKEYSVFGMMYGFVSDHVPFANTIFRFGDTKFHAMIAFGGAVCAAFFITSLLSYLEKKQFLKYGAYGFITAILLCSVWGFKSYFNGNFIGFFMYNKLPQAYWDMAQIINSDKEDVRVVQLPFDTHTYWKPYSWGYFGSSFLHFMINKPLFDRTFEPASEEGAQIHRQIIDIYHQAASVHDQNMLRDRTLDLARLFSSLSIKYVIDDQTVSTNIDARNIAYWGTIAPIDSHELLTYMRDVGLIRQVKEYTIPPQEFAKEYEKLYPYNSPKKSISYEPRKITLYALVESEPQISFVTQLDKVNSSYSTRIHSHNMRNIEGHYIQDKTFDEDTLVFPFDGIKNTDVHITDKTLTLSSEINLAPSIYSLTSEVNTGDLSQIVDIYTQTNKDSVDVLISDAKAPKIKGAQEFNSQIFRKITIPTRRNDYSLLVVGDQLLDIRHAATANLTFAGTVLLNDLQANAYLIFPEISYNVSGTLIGDGSNPQCINDSYENPESSVNNMNGILTLKGKNISTCFTSSINLNTSQKKIGYLRFEFTTKGIAKDISEQKTIDSGKLEMDNEIRALPNPLVLNVCIKPEDSQTCINKETLFPIPSTSTAFSIPLQGNFENIKKLLVTFVVRSNQRQSYEIEITKARLQSYSSSENVEIPNQMDTTLIGSYSINTNQRLSMSFPIVDTRHTQNLNLQKQAVLNGRDVDCDKIEKYQAIKTISEGILSYAVGCKNYLNKNIPFTSSNFYLWDVEYKHLSGAMPGFIIMDKYSTYAYNKLYPSNISVNNYFSIPFQKPESAQTQKLTLEENISQSPVYSIHGFIYPAPELENVGNKELIIEHFSQNEEVAVIKSISLIQVPEQWAYSVLKKDDYTSLIANKPTLIRSERLLPTLAKIKLNSNGEKNFLIFNEQYDKQWILLGATSYEHYKCDGSINCYIVNAKKGTSTLYLFYYPELLEIGGYTITLLVAIFGMIFLRKSK